MAERISSVVVIGAGVMGGGIAAQVANAGMPVTLLDRGDLAARALDRLRKADPAAFMSPKDADLVTTGDVDTDLDRVVEADWVIEAIVEDVAVKRALYERLERAIGPETIVSSNTSTIPLAMLTEGRGPDFRRRFCVTHFFNPPRYMRLMELVAGPETDPAVAEAVRETADRRLGKGVVDAHDTPGFIANRIGTFWIQAGLNAAIDLGLSVEEADAVMGRPLGIPKTGIFGLMDLVGIDLMPQVSASLMATLPEGDAYRTHYREHALIGRMIADGHTGRKGKGGFYRLNREGGRREKQAIDLATGAYHPAERPTVSAVEAAKAGGPAALIEHDSRAGRYVWAVLGPTLAYAASLVPAIAADVAAVDRAMRLGYNWAYGPFELIDRIGVDRVIARLEADGVPLPPLFEAARGRGFYRQEPDGGVAFLGTDGDYRPVERPAGVLLLADVKRAARPLTRNASAALWDLGDGVTCLEFTSRMNTLDEQTMALLAEALAITASDHRAMVVYNEGENFSVGANLGFVLFAANIGLWGQIEGAVKAGQDAYRAIKYAPIPVVAAPAGMALGGGCEILLHAHAVQAHAETYCGLVEAGVGIVPAWGGCKEMLLRAVADRKRPGGPMPAVNRVFETIALAKVARSAKEAKALGYLRADDGITMNRDRLLADAKARALALAEDFTPRQPARPIRLPGPSARTALMLAVDGLAKRGLATAHDRVVAEGLATVLSGGDTDLTEDIGEDQIARLERQVFATLVRREETLERMEHMLETGKPLRN